MRRYPVLIGLVALAIMLVGLLLFALFSKDLPRVSDYDPGPPPRDLAYCEQPRPDALIWQPASTWSGLCMSAVGLAILAVIPYTRRKTNRPRISSDSLPPSPTSYALLMGLLVVWLGPGAMFLHATMTRVGGWFDQMSMMPFILFIIWYNVMRLSGMSWGLFLGLLGGSVVVAGVLSAIGNVIDVNLGLYLFALLVAGAIVFEIVMQIRQPALFSWWFVAGLGIFGLAMLVWSLAGTGGPLCELMGEDSLLQGHALWHMLSGLSTGAFFLHYAREGTRT